MEPTTSKSLLTTIYIVYYFQVAAVVFVTGMMTYLVSMETFIPESPDMRDIFLYTNLGLLILLAPAGIYIYKVRIKSANQSPSLRGKIQAFQAAMLIRMACFEISGMFGAIGIFLTADYVFILFPALSVFLMLYFRPAVERICEDLDLSLSESADLRSPDSVIP